uniref:ATP synthase complex subunit 8 n=1 Tax=Hemipsilichthys nimius TaxID=245754 RepID=A0A1W5K123_9TELE|nr:ATPase subunit 8 [Hemipsilichthys nimius]
MPQLNPTPWLTILVYSWLIFITVIPHKILNHTFTNELNPINPKKLESTTWNWPWC